MSYWSDRLGDDDLDRLCGVTEKEVWDVARVDRLNEKPNSRGRELGRGELEIAGEGLAQFVGCDPLRRDPREAVELLAPECCSVLNRAADAVLKLADPIGQACDASLALRPIARRQIVKHLSKAVLLQSLYELLLFVRIGK
jgi:hypothetical protein